MLDRESILRRGGELELECPDLGSDLMGNNGESKLSYYKHGSVGVNTGLWDQTPMGSDANQ